MKITLAFVHDGEAAWLQSAYDEFTRDEHGGVPDWHTEALSKIGSGEQVREVVIDIDYRTVEALFSPVEIPATIVGGES